MEKSTHSLWLVRPIVRGVLPPRMLWEAIMRTYKGALGTSVVRVFEAVAGTTGLSLKQARALGYDADAVVVHKEHHTSIFLVPKLLLPCWFMIKIPDLF